MIIDIMTLGCGRNIDMELQKTFLQEFFQSKMENDGVRCSFSTLALIETCGDQNFIQIKNRIKWIHFR